MNKLNLQDFTVFLKNSFLSPQTYSYSPTFSWNDAFFTWNFEILIFNVILFIYFCVMYFSAENNISIEAHEHSLHLYDWIWIVYLISFWFYWSASPFFLLSLSSDVFLEFYH